MIESRDADEGVRRRRACMNAACNGRFTTYERVQPVALFIAKKDGRREEFSREKLLAGLRKACEKRPLGAGALEALAGEIEGALYRATASEIPSAAVGEMVMEGLRDLDPIAYVRFASVYREFRDVEAFREELEALGPSARPTDGQLRLPVQVEASPLSLRLQPAAPNSRTRTRRPVRPVQAPSPLRGTPAPRDQSKRKRKA